MANPFYANNNTAYDFVSFMQKMKGKNPNEIINSLISDGKISQQQLNVVQQKAKQMSGLFDGFKHMFGYK